MELRPAGRADLAAVRRLLAARESLAPPPGAAAWQTARWDAHLGSVDAAPFLATADGEPVGLLMLTFRRRLNFATWEAWVPELIVAAPFRRRGIGRALLRVAIEEWRLRGAHRLSVDLEPGEEAGRQLLGGMGLADTFIRLRLEPMSSITGHDRQPPPNVAIRALEPGDFGGATRLIAEMGPRHSPVPDRMDAVERVFRELARRPADRSAVAVVEEVVVGICTMELRETLRRKAPELWIPELVVTEHMRGRGIGAALLHAALAIGAAAGATRTLLESGPQRAAAHALYQSTGFADAGRVYTLFRDR